MITKITGEQPFQVLTNNFSISPSQEGYTLQISADGKQYSNLFSVGAGVTRLVTGVAANSYYRLLGNQSQVSINWMKTCVTEGGSGSGTELTPVAEFPLGAAEGTVVALASGDTVGLYQFIDGEWVLVGADDPTKLLAVNELPVSAEPGTVMALYQEGEGGGVWEGPANDHYTFNCNFSKLDTAQTYDIAYLGPGNMMYERGDIYLKYLNGVWNLYAHTREWGGYDEETGDDIWVEEDKYIPLTPVTGSPLPSWGGWAERCEGEECEEYYEFSSQVIVWDGQNIMVGDWNYDDQAWNDISNFQRFLEGGEFRLSNIEGGSGAQTVMSVYQYDGQNWSEVGADVDLSAYWTSAQTKTYVDTGFWTSAQTKDYVDSAITAVEDHIYDVEKVTASALTELHADILELSGNTPDLSAFWSSAETKDYVDSASTVLQDQIDIMDEVVSEALVDLNERIGEISGSSVDLSGYYTSAETDNRVYVATAGKANAANIAANTGNFIFPKWNSQGIISGVSQQVFKSYLNVNDGGGGSYFFMNSRKYDTQNKELKLYTPLSAGTAGDILVSTGSGAPVWSAMPAADVTKAYVDSADTALQNQIDTMDEVVSAALVDLNTRKVESTSVSTIWKGTQAEYDAIVTKDASTLYIIVNNS